MKRIFIVVVLMLSVVTMGAQPKNADAAASAIAKAKAATENVKKAVKADTWVKLAKSYIEAYDLPAANVVPGTPQAEAKLFLKDQKVLETVQKTGGDGTPYVVDVFADKELWYNQEGILDFFLVTKPVTGDELDQAYKALVKAHELDEKGSKAKDITALMEQVHDKYYNEALYNYLSGDFKKAADLFGETGKAYDNPVLNKMDTLSVYYRGLIAGFAGDTEVAKEQYQKCIDLGFYQDGLAYSNFAEICKKAGDVDKAKKLLEDGFAKFPQSQGILVGLINLYIETKDDPQKLFSLLHSAQENEPNNASLFYVEGNVYKELGDTENAVKMYAKSQEIDPNYVYGPLSIGMLLYDKAVDIQTAASEEYDDAKYNVLLAQFEETLESAIQPFEKSYTITNDPEIKSVIAEYLKNIYFRFRDKSDAYQQAYEKYNNILKGE